MKRLILRSGLVAALVISMLSVSAYVAQATTAHSEANSAPVPLLSLGASTTSNAKCSEKGGPCKFSSDCCGNKLFCMGGDAGKPHYCREVGEK